MIFFGLVYTHLLLMTIVAAATSVQKTAVPNVKCAEIILICGLTDQIHDIVVGCTDNQRRVRIVVAWDMGTAGPLNLANRGYASYARQAMQNILY